MKVFFHTSDLDLEQATHPIMNTKFSLRKKWKKVEINLDELVDAKLARPDDYSSSEYFKYSDELGVLGNPTLTQVSYLETQIYNGDPNGFKIYA